MMRHRRTAVAALLSSVALVGVLAGCAAPGDVAVVRNPGQFVVGTDGDGLPDLDLAPTAPTASDEHAVFELDGELWRVREILLSDPVLGSTIVTASLENVETGEVVIRSFDASALPPMVGG